MSTKIYNAYRCKKSIDVKAMFDSMRVKFREKLAQDKIVLSSLHEEATKKFPDMFYVTSIKRLLEKAESSLLIDFFDLKFKATLLWDSKYYYIKFYPNSPLMYGVLKETIEEYKLEDYHYQNQTDPPDDIPHRRYEARSDKWDSFMDESYTFRHWPQVTIFDSKEMETLLWDAVQGKIELAYDFKNNTNENDKSESGDGKEVGQLGIFGRMLKNLRQ